MCLEERRKRKRVCVQENEHVFIVGYLRKSLAEEAEANPWQATGSSRENSTEDNQEFFLHTMSNSFSSPFSQQLNSTTNFGRKQKNPTREMSSVRHSSLEIWRRVVLHGLLLWLAAKECNNFAASSTRELIRGSNNLKSCFKYVCVVVLSPFTRRVLTEIAMRTLEKKTVFY